MLMIKCFGRRDVKKLGKYISDENSAEFGFLKTVLELGMNSDGYSKNYI